MKQFRKDFIKAVFIFFFSLILILMCQNMGACGDFSLGFLYGTSFVFTEKEYNEYGWSGEIPVRYFSTPDLNTCWGGYFLFFPKDGKLGFSLELFKQNYNEIMHTETNGLVSSNYSSHSAFTYLIWGVDYRFFATETKRINPYLSVDLMYLLYLDLFGSGAPEYPTEFAVRFGGGIKFKIVNKLSINSDFHYYSLDSFYAIRIGLEFEF